jgi:hypothetical protein
MVGVGADQGWAALRQWAALEADGSDDHQLSSSGKQTHGHHTTPPNTS